jgi:secreted trypsin-like serine protease
MNSISSFIVTLFVLACVMQTVMADRSKIINGELAVAGQFPFLVQLYNKTGYYNFCGGSLIGAFHVLTAAHCTDGAAASELQIWAGSLNLNNGGYKVDVQAIYIHPDYDAATISNDVSVIKLAKPFPKTVGTRTVKLATTSAAPGVTVTASGFGSIVPAGGTYPDDLMFVDITVISSTQCASFFSINSNKMLCAYDVNQGTCYGDSGGPLVTGSKTTATQHGVVSFGSANGCATAPSVFARVSHFRPWILSKTVHTIATPCPDCAVDAEWKGLCENMGGTFGQTVNNYQCKNLDVDKTRKVNFEWFNGPTGSGCSNTQIKSLCDNVGRYSCVDAGSTGKCAFL